MFVEYDMKHSSSNNMTYKMISNYFFVLLLVCFSYAQREKKFFRKDYKYIESTETFYKFHTLRTNWTDARRICELEGANFFYPENNLEADAILNFWNETQPFTSIYVGISDLVVKGVFETIDGVPVSEVYNNWLPGEPNDAGGVEDCVVMIKTGTYNDDRCSLKQPFLCKKRLSALEWNIQCDMPNLDYTFDEAQGKCYKFHKEAVSWTDAYQACQAEQSYLAVIDSVEESDLIAINYAPNGTIHIGYHNRLGLGWRTSKGQTLDNNGIPWDLNQPDGQEREEKCGAMSTIGLLHDISCDEKSFFICEHDLDIARSQNNSFTPPPN